jgi:nitrogen-specific signal transduction histidine kinase
MNTFNPEMIVMQYDRDNKEYFGIKTEEEYRKLSYMFPEYIFLDNDYSIKLAGRNIEELLNYRYGTLQDKSINMISYKDDLKSSFMIQIAGNFFEWRTYLLKNKNEESVQVEICGFRMSQAESNISPIAMRVRISRNYLEPASIPALDKLTYWMAHNLRGPLATLMGLINLARTREDNSEIETYLNYMSTHAQRLDEKIQQMVRIANRIIK